MFLQYIKIKPNQGDILIGLWFPWCQDCDKDAIQQLVGIVGAVIMPHNIYLHSSLVLVSFFLNKKHSPLENKVQLPVVSHSILP